MSEFKVKTRFVLLSSARSGTTAVVAGLDQHPNIYCHREVFHRNSITTVREEYREDHDVAFLREDPVAFVESLYSFTPGPECVGFKMWRDQAPDACSYLLADTLTYKIILERENRLACYSSNQIAKATGVYHATNDQNFDKNQSILPDLRFDREDFERMVHNSDGRFSTYHKAAKGPQFYLKYSDIGPQVFRDLFRFLGQEDHEVDMQYRKLNSSNTLSRFHKDDHQLILETLEALGHPEWATE